MTPDAASGPPAPRFLFWTLVLALACPLRVDFPIGPFATISVVDFALMLCGVYLAVRFAALAPARVGPPALLVAVLTPAFLALLSMLWALDTDLATATTIKYFYTALIYFVALQFSDNLDRGDLIRTCCVLLFGWLLGSLAMYLGMPGFAFFVPESLGLSEGEMVTLLASVYTRLGHPYVGQSNDFGPLLALLGFVLLGCARLRSSKLLTAASALAFFAGILTFSRGLIVGLSLSLALYAWIAHVPLKRVAVYAAAAAAVFGALAFQASDFSVMVGEREIEVAEIVEGRLSEVNVTARLDGYLETLALISDRPLLGSGAGYFDNSRPDALVAAHNAFLEQWKYFGVVLGSLSIACYLLVAAYFFRMRSSRAGPFYDAMACAWIFLLATSLVQTFFEATMPRTVIYFMLGLCVGPPLREPRASGRALRDGSDPPARTRDRASKSHPEIRR